LFKLTPIDYVNRFKTTTTVIFADADEREVHAVIDYHAAGSAKPGLVEQHAPCSPSRILMSGIRGTPSAGACTIISRSPGCARR
jgi:hypothetical protein